MTIIFRDPWLLMEIRRNADNSVQHPFPGESRAGSGNWEPAVDIWEEDGRYVIRADVPGISAEDIQVSLDTGLLSIKGERRPESPEGKPHYQRMERSRSPFERSFRLPRDVDGGQISATVSNGVLQVSLPKSDADRPRRIAVRH